MKTDQTDHSTQKKKRGETVRPLQGREFQIRVEKVTTEIRRATKKNLSCSETRSLCSDIPAKSYRWNLGGLKGLSAREAIALLLYSNQIHNSYDTLIRIELERLCQYKKYQGLWMLVHKLLKLYYLDERVHVLLESHVSENEIFGNYLGAGLERLKKINLYDPLRGSIKKPQRKRGYNDHGSRREDSKWRETNYWSGPNPPKPDHSKLYQTKRKHFLNFLWR